ncbi:MAG: hypothetical protein RLZZ292_1746 [Bacteroidota bacterium]|jgi:hypothetical protein
MNLNTLSFFVLLTLASCSTGKQLTNTLDTSNDATTTYYEQPKEEILFVFLKMNEDTLAGEQSTTLVQTTKVEGKLKKDFGTVQQVEEGHLLCSFLNQEKHVIKQTLVEHPLHRHFEVPQQNGQWQNFNVRLAQADLTLRTQYDAAIRYVKVEAIGEGGSREVIGMVGL